MAFLEYNSIGISAISAAVPRNLINNYEYTDFFSPEQARLIVDKIGVKERRFADKDTCSSDLCFAAAKQLLQENNTNIEEIDLLIFVSQTPDYRMPATSVLLQNRLGLSQKTMAFDINLGCSGFIYGLSTVYALMQQSGFRKALLLDGETRSKVYSSKDRQTAFIFGDAGVAALIEKDAKFGNSYFSLNSDGSKENLIKIESGGYRNPSSSETVKEYIADEYGNIRTLEQGYMNGGDVFNFVIKNVPSDINGLLDYSKKTTSDVDHFVFHQANEFINSYLVKKLKLDSKKVPSTIAKYGNTSSVSVPLTIVSELGESLTHKTDILMSAFGVGMTWASAIITLDNCVVGKIVEV